MPVKVVWQAKVLMSDGNMVTNVCTANYCLQLIWNFQNKVAFHVGITHSILSEGLGFTASFVGAVLVICVSKACGAWPVCEDSL